MAKRPDVRHLARHTLRAIADRLKYDAPEALRSIERDGPDVVIRLNSAGNACAVEEALLGRGYDADHDGGNPDGYGCAVRVRGAAQ